MGENFASRGCIFYFSPRRDLGKIRISRYTKYTALPLCLSVRFSVKTVELSPAGQLVVGGQAGQLLLCQITSNRVSPGQARPGQTSLSSLKEFDIAVTDIDLMAEDEDFVWKGQEPMDVRSCQFRHPAGFRPHHILQLDPPSSITSLAINTDWGLVAAGESFCFSCFHFNFLENISGSAFGFIIFDMKCHQVVSWK